MDHVQGQICQTEDALLQYRMLKRENAVSRIVSMTSELLGPNVDDADYEINGWQFVDPDKESHQ